MSTTGRTLMLLLRQRLHLIRLLLPCPESSVFLLQCFKHRCKDTNFRLKSKFFEHKFAKRTQKGQTLCVNKGADPSVSFSLIVFSIDFACYEFYIVVEAEDAGDEQEGLGDIDQQTAADVVDHDDLVGHQGDAADDEQHRTGVLRDFKSCVFHSVVERKIFFEHESLELHEFFLYLDYS